MSARTKTYFISDIHLGAAYLDRQRLRERMLVEWLDEIADDAKSLYLVGDILDYWYEYRTVVPRGYVRFFGALARLADSGVKITWLTGNHDIWLFDYIRDEIGIEVVDGSVIRDIDGKTMFISHGDGLGQLKPSFRFIRTLFRNRLCQKLFSAIHPRWTVGFAHAWSAHNRDYNPNCIPTYDGTIQTHVEKWAEGYIAGHPQTCYIILGHHHVVVDKPINSYCRLIILGDWIYNYTYAVFDGQELSVKQFARANSCFNKFSRSRSRIK